MNKADFVLRRQITVDGINQRIVRLVLINESCTLFDYFELRYRCRMSKGLSEVKTVLPPDNIEALADLSLFLETMTEPAALLGPDGQTVPLPLETYEVLVDVVIAMRHGRAITLAPQHQRLTTQEAANLLGISRPTLVKLLDAGEISYEQPNPGRHRRIRLTDLLEYQQRKRQERREILDELTQEASKLGLYSADVDYSEALKKARKNHT